MGSSFGGTVKLTGESEYRKALREITNNLKVLNSEMKTVTSQFDKNDRSTSNLSQQSAVLTKKISEQRDKVNILTEALEQARRETGENSDTTKKWQIELNNAQADLNKLERALKNNNDALNQQDNALDKTESGLKDYTDATEGAGTGTLKLADIIKANLISEGIIAGVRALGKAMQQVGSALVDVGKQAFDSYARYEQLVGGIETLFKDSQDTVMKYAHNAYLTAGMSANTYMETVTGFSASLIQSLGGDTQKVAEISEMAITDMADNANKMGTSMESIRYAYMGFAKQNYTMLDNLKLGYGGTKAEMQRLLADAQKITGIKYDISNLADVYNAIHVIQGELGITGTTALEANTTIEGSMNRLKASWENTLVAIADDNADFDTVIKNLVESIVIFGKNALPRVEIIVDGIVNLILSIGDELIKGLPEIMESGTKLLQSIVDGVVAALPQLGSVAGQVVTGLGEFIFSNLPTMVDAGIKLLVGMGNGFAESIPNLIPIAVEGVLKLADTMIENIDIIIDAGVNIIIGLASGLIKAIPQLLDKIPTIIESIVTALLENIPKIISAGVTLTLKLGEGLIKAIPSLVKMIPKIISAIYNGIKSGIRNMVSIGTDLIKGLWEGMANAKDWLWEQAKGLMSGFTRKLKKFFGIKSPSRLFKDEIGNNLALGIGEGFTDTMKNVTRDMTQAIPTEFDTSVRLNGGDEPTLSFGAMVLAFKQALKEMKIELDDREVGNFVTRTVEREVFA